MESTQGQSDWLPIPRTTQTINLSGTDVPYCRIVLTVKGQDCTAKWQVSTDGQHWNDHDSTQMVIADRTYTLQPDGKLIGAR